MKPIFFIFKDLSGHQELFKATVTYTRIFKKRSFHVLSSLMIGSDI